MDRILRNCWRNMIQACSTELDPSKCTSSCLFFQQSEPPSLMNNVLLDEFHERFPFIKNLTVKSMARCKTSSDSPGAIKTLLTHNHFLPMYSVFYAGKAYYEPSKISFMESYENRLVSLSRASQYLHLSQKFHECVTDNEPADTLNKAMTLIGDLFITEMYRSLARVNSSEITRIMSETLAIAAEGNFPPGKNQGPGIATLEAQEALYASSFKCVAILNGLSPEKAAEVVGIGALIGNLVHTTPSYLEEPLIKKIEITQKFNEWIQLAQQSLGNNKSAKPLKMFLEFLEIRRHSFRPEVSCSSAHKDSKNQMIAPVATKYSSN